MRLSLVLMTISLSPILADAFKMSITLLLNQQSILRNV